MGDRWDRREDSGKEAGDAGITRGATDAGDTTGGTANLHSIKDIRSVMARHGLAPNKQLGQNFLLDGNVLAKIADAAEVEGGAVLEIGPGLGALTRELAQRADRVLAVELDRGFIGVLGETLAPWATPVPQAKDAPPDDETDRSGEMDGGPGGIGQRDGGAHSGGGANDESPPPRRVLTVLDGREGERWPEGARVAVLHGDFLKQDLGHLHDLLGGGPFGVCANLPYYITTPIIMKLLQAAPPSQALLQAAPPQSGLPIGNMVFLLQKEVAERMAATPGSKQYGSLSIAVQHYAALEVVAKVPPGCFWPPPKVDSVVLRLRLRTPDYQVEDEKAFFALIRAAFAMRRKTIVNNLKAAWPERVGEVAAALAACGISERARAEELSPADFAALFGALGTN